ncbi:MAG: radical SAM protein, partial [Gemmatimonadota bacterium]|nr:radical SAM protein [Gemmatimonadota bacterium]
RSDLEEIARAASDGGATVVVGTNGTGLTDARIGSLRGAGVQGVALSVDSLDPRYHDRFRHGEGALDDTLAAVERLREHGLDFLVQLTVTRGNRHEIEAVAAWAEGKGAVCLNVYFLVETGRAEGMRGLTPEENDDVLARLEELQRVYRGRLMIRSKCQPQLMRHVYERDPDSPLLHYRTRCPCGVQYCRITPEGKVTPCPYMPEVAGDLCEASFAEIWHEATVFKLLRDGELGGRCGRCEYRRVCGGCRARAYAVDGDLLGEDPSCAYDPGPTARPPVAPARDVTYGDEARLGMTWTPEAEARLEAIPSFVRGVVASRVETYARGRGRDRITLELMREVRRDMPVDFSKRLPAFMGGARRSTSPEASEPGGAPAEANRDTERR